MKFREISEKLSTSSHLRNQGKNLRLPWTKFFCLKISKWPCGNRIVSKKSCQKSRHWNFDIFHSKQQNNNNNTTNYEAVEIRDTIATVTASILTIKLYANLIIVSDGYLKPVLTDKQTDKSCQHLNTKVSIRQWHFNHSFSIFHRIVW